MTRIAVLGTGRMGGAIARRLNQAGLTVTLWDRTRERAERLNLGRVAATPEAAVGEAAIVLSSLTGPAAVRDVYLGPNGALHAARGKVFVEMSTAGPEVVLELDRQVQASGARLIEAPVLGSVPAVETGTLAVLVGGRPEDAEVARPVLSRLGEVHYVGALGSAARLKLVANSMLAIISAAAAELLAAGKAAGLDQQRIFWALSRYAPVLKPREAGFLRDQHEPTMFAVRDLVKDLNLAVEVYASPERRVPLMALARDLFTETGRRFADLDISAITRQYANQKETA